MRRTVAWLLPMLLSPALALAAPTQSFLLATSDAFEKGKFEGTAVHGDGRVARGVSTRRTPIDGASVAYSSAVGPDGAIYVGTGNQGHVYSLDKAGYSLFARTNAPLISALSWVGDTLYAGTLEQGKVLAISRKGEVKELASLPGAAHVWALAYDALRSTLYAATGPEGKLFSVGRDGAVKVVHDDAAEHLLSLAIDGEGRKYVGTSDGARLLRITAEGASVLYDAPGQELTALALGPGFVAVASNEFPEPIGGDPPKDGPRVKAKPGKGKVFAVSYDGLIEEIYRSDACHITALEVDAASEAVHVGLGLEGRVVRVDKGHAHTTWADADERQVVSIRLSGPSPHFVSSDGVAVYRVEEPKEKGLWTSAVLDAKVKARFGELSFRRQGSVTLASRSGNTETPDDTWSPWSGELSASGPIRSPAARFLQVRASLAQDATLYAVEAFYLPQNLVAFVRNVRAAPARVSDKAGSTAVTASETSQTSLRLSWDVENQDSDKLRYRVSYRREGHDRFLPIHRDDEVLEKNEVRWETASVPDGYYRVRVEASDELSTPEPFVQRHETTSGPILVDNHAPRVVGLQVANGRLKGQAEDSLSPISALELSINGGPFRPISPRDGILDTKRESFEVVLDTLPKGSHTLAVRATDSAENSSTSAVELPSKP